MPKAKQFNAALQALKNKLPQTGFFSTLDELIDVAPQEAMTAKQWKEYLQPGRILTREGINFPLKKEELDYSKVNEFLDGLNAENPNTPVHKEYLRAGAQGSRPLFQSHSNAAGVHDDNTPFSQYSTQGPNRFGYIESLTDAPDFGDFSTHFMPTTLSWHRGSRHALEPGRDPRIHADSPVLRLIDEIQSDRHSAAAQKVEGPHRSFREFLTPEEEAEFRGLADPGDEQSFRRAEELRDLGESRRPQPRRRGYRTPEQEQEIQDLNDEVYHGPRGSEYYESRLAATNRLKDLKRIPPDAPFKDPADYGRLEMKKAILDAIERGDRYVGITPSEGPEGWFRFHPNSPEAKGSQYTYDKIYPGELRKIANQYGAPFTQVELPVTDRAKQYTNSVLAEANDDIHAFHDLPDYLEMIGQGHEEDWVEDIRRLVRGFNLPSNRPDIRRQAQRKQERIHELVDRFQEKFKENGGYHNDDTEELVRDVHDHILELDNLLADHLEQPDAAPRKVPAMELTPEVVEKIKKAGIPLWAITSGLIGTEMLSRDADKEPQTYSSGGKVKDEGDDPEEIEQQIRDQEVMRHRKNNALSLIDRAAQVMGTPEKSGRRRHLIAGLASQLYGLDTKGDAKFLGFDPSRRPTNPTSPLGGILSMFRPGIVDETLALPNMFGTGPKWSKDAERRTEDLGERVNQSMNNLEAPQGFGENLARAGGTMLGQLPIGIERAGAEAAAATPGILGKVGRYVKDKGTGAMEFFSPTVQPSVGNYAAGTAFGGVLGTMPEWLEKMIESHPEAAARIAESFRDSTPEEQEMLRQQLLAGPAMAQGGEVVGMSDPNQYLPQPSTPLQSASRYIGSPKTEAELANYGSGPEARYFETGSTPMNIDFSKEGTGASMPQATPGGSSSLGNAVMAGLGLYKGLGTVDSLLGTGMQSSVKNGILGGIKGLFGAGAAAPAGALAPVTGAGLPTLAEMAATSGAQAGSALAGVGGAEAAGAGTTAATPGVLSSIANVAFPTAVGAGILFGPGGVIDAIQNKGLVRGSYDPGTGNVGLNFDSSINRIAKNIGITPDQVTTALTPLLQQYAKTGDRAALDAAISMPKGYKLDTPKMRLLSKTPFGQGVDPTQGLLYYLVHDLGLGKGKGDIISSIDKAMGR